MSRIQRLGFFTRLLDNATASERYRLATEQIVHAEALGFDAAWVAQHHFHEAEGGLPSPLVFLAQVAAKTQRIRLGTGIVTLPLENPVRVAEDAVVLDLLSNGRLEFGVGTGGTPSSFAAFGLDSAQRAEVFAAHLALLRHAWAGRPLPGGDRLYPSSPQLLDRVWQASFSVAGAERAGRAGDGLMLSRTQPRTAEAPHATLAEIQLPLVDAYLSALPAGRAGRIVGSRSVFVADDRALARRLAEEGLRRSLVRQPAAGAPAHDAPLDVLIARQDVHVGTPTDVIASLRADRTLQHVTDLVCQVHSVDPPHRHILRSIELIATEVAPALGWAPERTLSEAPSNDSSLQTIA
ncbi:putative FMN-dependent luciferase-like monooxygenase [Variovorax sp. OV329]|uniref:putative FMN-dependent luciferase-like monooxygenase n=1 Tax=Variovorax sp. OV329 TaxID=1882825 RepID=UPI0008EA0F84|nr:putative FMN-dependent luciferase-like monooxygenase [Variovorax sp. OV329]SFM58972.1 putative FMN-dependent luciferase-like monooxygenase, KPN_01858 family [Variovorax sp. OV329]